jgi:hypothetical protein
MSSARVRSLLALAFVCGAAFGCGARSGLDAVEPEVAAGSASCPSAQTAYLWSQTGELLTFDPNTLATQSLGTVACPTTSVPWTLSVSRTGFGYMLYEDWNVYRVDLATLACTRTAYVPFQLGFSGQEGIAVSRNAGAERFYVYGMGTSGPLLAVTDFTSFVLAPVGPVTPPPTAFPLDIQGDARGRLFALSDNGELAAIDSATAAVIVDVQTGFHSSDWAVMTYGSTLYFFGNGDGEVSRYDLTSRALTPLGKVNVPIIGASAYPCITL